MYEPSIVMFKPCVAPHSTLEIRKGRIERVCVRVCVRVCYIQCAKGVMDGTACGQALGFTLGN